MVYAVFKVPKEQSLAVAKVCGDDIVSRQSITTRDGDALGLDESFKYVMIEGSEESLERARELFSDMGCSEEMEKAAETYKCIKDEEDNAAAGMGAVFDWG